MLRIGDELCVELLMQRIKKHVSTSPRASASGALAWRNIFRQVIEKIMGLKTHTMKLS